jgi:hypothetical protein
MTNTLAVLYRQREELLKTISEAIPKAGTQNYGINDSDGSQSIGRRSLTELYKALEMVNSQITELERALRGGGIRTFSIRLRP